MHLAGDARRWVARTLTAAYAHGLLSEDTFAQRLDEALSARLIDSRRLVGDLHFRAPTDTLWGRLSATMTAARDRLFGVGAEAPHVALALDWSANEADMLLGRESDCDIRLEDPTVSRRHARLLLRDGHWVVHDLNSLNGTRLNGVRVNRSELRPGDHLELGEQHLVID